MNKRLQRLWLFFTNWMELDTFDSRRAHGPAEPVHRQTSPPRWWTAPTKKASRVCALRSVPHRDYARYYRLAVWPRKISPSAQICAGRFLNKKTTR